jgi:hypothetical protein
MDLGRPRARRDEHSSQMLDGCRDAVEEAGRIVLGEESR